MNDALHGLTNGPGIPPERCSEVADVIGTVGLSLFGRMPSMTTMEAWADDGMRDCKDAGYAPPERILNKTTQEACWMTGYIHALNEHHGTSFIGDYGSSKFKIEA